MDLGIDGQSVTEIQLGYTVSLAFTDGHCVLIEGDFTDTHPDGQFEVALENGISEAPAEQLNHLRGTAVCTATVSDTGSLTLKFRNGSQIVVHPDPAYEAWSFSGRNGIELVCMPGGDVAVFR